MENDGTWRTRSFWFATLGEDVAPEPLDGSTEADVVIAGGGYSGLWTALMLKEADPSLDVAIVEKEICGFGGSGRNGGFAMTLLDFSLHHLVKNQGVEPARAAHNAVSRSVHEIGDFVSKHQIDCEFEPNGYIEIATSPSHLGRLRRDLEAAEALGLTDWNDLDQIKARERLDSPRVLGGVFEPDCAVLNPAKLARGLRRVAIERGVRIYERTPLTAYRDHGDGVTFRTTRGDIKAGRGVLTLNPWMDAFPSFRRKTVPVYTYAMASDPLDAEQVARLGWPGREGIEDKRNYIHYFRLTAGNRIVWAGGDAVYYYGSKVGTPQDRREQAYRQLITQFEWYFPQLKGLLFPYRWGGPVAVTADFLPYVGSSASGTLHYGYGCNGHGVAPSHTWGQMLRDLVLGRATDLTALLFRGRKEAAFPPEPLRWVGAEATRQSLRRQDRAMQRGKEVGDTDPMILKIVKALG